MQKKSLGFKFWQNRTWGKWHGGLAWGPQLESGIWIALKPIPFKFTHKGKWHFYFGIHRFRLSI